MDEKSRIRQQVLRKRDSIDPATRKAKDLLIIEKFLSLSEFERSQAILFFASFRSEVSTVPLIEEALRLGKRVVLPSVDPAHKELRLYEIKGLNELSPGYMSIPEPVVPGERERDINDVTLAVVPGAAFDSRGNRLGYGAGFYDRLLSRLKRQIPLIAIAYEEQIVDSLPSEPHDIRVHMIVTDKGVIACRLI
ncbi:MAG: 5-formyltetrahydrofolate cyclo-ligase [Nitrospirae bacterium]|nr:5-formyltetrahydrofolate cyclo-ligase [Nitrospirota bacterium]MCL5422887.1 5-formyltetrahydrofolate cyclo-ligase [Nitrospirota bacterium]